MPRKEEKKKEKKEKLTERRKRQILEAAIKEFAENGFNGAKTKKIAERAGVAEGTIFRYFKTKKDILLNLVNTVATESIYKFMEEAGDFSDDKKVLTKFLQNHMRFIRENFDLIKLLIYETQFHDDLKAKFLDDLTLKITGLLEEYVKEKIENGEFKKIDPSIAVRALLGMYISLIIWKNAFEDEKHVELDDLDIIEGVVGIFLNGVKKPKEENSKS